MSLEESIAKLTAAVEANTAALKAGGTAPAADKGGKAATAADKGGKTAPAAKKVEPKRSVEEVKKAAGDLATAKSKEAAKAVIESLGAKALADILNDPSKLDAAYDAFIAAAAEETQEDDGTDGL